MAQFIHEEIQERIATITLNRPEKRNSLHPQLISELTLVFRELEHDDTVKVVILKALGTVFSAGADLQYLNQLQSNSYEENLEDSGLLKDLFIAMYFLSKPVIAQVEGDAIAGGCGLISVADIVFAVPESRFGYTEVKLGFVPAIVTSFLIRKIGEGRTKELLLSGELINAETAFRYGLVNFIEGSDRIEQRVQEYAAKLVRNASSQALKITKNLIEQLSNVTLREGLEIAAQVNAAARLTDDCKKGIEAFLNKQRPEW